jgi:hypothetical protein
VQLATTPDEIPPPPLFSGAPAPPGPDSDKSESLNARRAVPGVTERTFKFECAVTFNATVTDCRGQWPTILLSSAHQGPVHAVRKPARVC